MSESNPMPQLSLAPSAPVPEPETSAAESIQQTAAEHFGIVKGIDALTLNESACAKKLFRTGIAGKHAEFRVSDDKTLGHAFCHKAELLTASEYFVHLSADLAVLSTELIQKGRKLFIAAAGIGVSKVDIVYRFDDVS